VSRLLGAPLNAEFIVYADPGRGDFRYATLVEGRLEACLFLGGPGAALPSRESLLAAFDDAVAPYRRANVLAGVRPGGTFDPAAGRTVCACFAVGLQAIQNAIRDDSLESVEEIGAALRAGTNCGSCIPELKQILRECAEPALA
jgi:assimilatory nitrate reductase catalytic subunit